MGKKAMHVNWNGWKDIQIGNSSLEVNTFSKNHEIMNNIIY